MLQSKKYEKDLRLNFNICIIIQKVPFLQPFISDSRKMNSK